MINLDKKYPDRLYFSIKEVAEFIDVPSSTLRYWGKEFSEIRPRTNGKGDRLYKKEDIALIREIHHLLKVKGYTIEGAQKQIAKKSSAPQRFEIVERLEKIKFFLKELRKNL